MRAAPGPYLLTYISAAIFSAWLPLAALWRRRPQAWCISLHPRQRMRYELVPQQEGAAGDLSSATARPSGGSSPRHIPGGDWRARLELLRLGTLFCPVWFLANWTFNASLELTSVASVTVLSATSASWTLLVSVSALFIPHRTHLTAAPAACSRH